MPTGAHTAGTRGHPPGRARVRVALACACVATVAILSAALCPEPPEANSPSFWRFLGGDLGISDVIANVVLFVPLGIVLGAACGRLRPAIAVTVVRSAALEAIQDLFIPGREASFSDLIAHAAGGALGAWGATHARLLLRPGRRQAARLAVVAACVAALVLGTSAWPLEPGAPSPAYGDSSLRTGSGIADSPSASCTHS